eukprot:1850360-Prymnesium_polylepis.1
MWLAELALTPELPVGWMVCHLDESAPPFYWHPTTALAQWEHPQESFVSGLAARFVRARQEETDRLRRS